jgi:hypothetical protein
VEAVVEAIAEQMAVVAEVAIGVVTYHSQQLISQLPLELEALLVCPDQTLFSLL